MPQFLPVLLALLERSHALIPGPALHIIATAIPESTEASDLRPHDMGSIHRFVFATHHAFGSPHISFFVVFTKDMWTPIPKPLMADSGGAETVAPKTWFPNH